MKKGIIVLLIAVLVAGFAFADGKAGDVTFTGSATISFDYDLDEKDYGLVNAKSTTFKFSFEFCSAEGGSKGEGNLYAEIAATATVSMDQDGDFLPGATVKITKANIVAGDVTINILGPKGFYSFAEFYADADYDETVDETLEVLDLDTHGFTVSYKDYEASFAFYHTELIGGHITQLYTGFKTPAYKLTDGLTLTAGGNFYLAAGSATTGIIAGGGLKVAYAPEGAKYSASLAYDAEAVVEDGELEILPMEISLNAKYDFLSADAYFITFDRFNANILNLLAAKLSASKAVNDQLTVGGYAEVAILQFLGENLPWFRFGANATYTAENFKLAATVDAWLQKVGDEYKLAGGEYFDGKDKPGLGITLDVSTTKLINNATVGLKWTGSDFAKNGADEATALGVISAYATVKF